MKRSAVLLSMALLVLLITPSTVECVVSAKQRPTCVVVLYAKKEDLAVSLDNLTVFLSLLEKNLSIEVRQVDSLTRYENLEGASALLLIGVKKFSEDLEAVVRTIKRFVEEGGSLLIAGHFSAPKALRNVTDVFGLGFSDAIIKSNDTRLCYRSDPSNVILSGAGFCYSRHPVLSGIDQLVLFKSLAVTEERPLNITFANITIPARRYPLIWGLNVTYLDKNKNNKFDEGEPSGRNVTLCYAVEMWTGARVLVFGSAEFFTNTSLTLAKNSILALNMIRWLTHLQWTVRFEGPIVEPTVAYIGRDKSINVRVNITLPRDVSIENVSVNACVVLLKRVIRSVQMKRVSERTYVASIDLSGLKRAQYVVRVLVYIRYLGYGWFWSPPARFTLLEQVVVAHPIALPAALWALAVGLSLVLLTASYRDLRKQREAVRKIMRRARKSEKG